MFYGYFLWITLILSIALLFILSYMLITYLHKKMTILINQFEEIKKLKENLLTKYK